MFSVLPLLIALLPARLKPFFYRRLLGWKIGNNVWIGLTYINGQQILIGDDVRIGHFNIIMTFRFLKIGSFTSIQNFNHFASKCDHPNWSGHLEIGERVNIMSHHFIDSFGRIEIGDGTTLAGREIHLWSHSLTYEKPSPTLSPLEILIGKDVYIGARATLVRCCVPDHAVVGAGSVVTRSFSPEQNRRLLIAGNPARIRKRYPLEMPLDVLEETMHQSENSVANLHR